jgi:6-phospho-beta-glucosidase
MLKVAVIGGGSTYTPELINGFIERQDQFPLDQLWLMDIDNERLDIVGRFAKRMAESKHAKFTIVLSNNQQEAIENSSYVITQLRVGQMEARREDEYLGKRHGLIGQETTGVGGMAKALRTIPVILEVANDIEKFAPSALLVNFANPSGLVTEALFRYAPGVTSVGVCNSALTTKMEMLEIINERLGTNFSPSEARIQTLGLNHLTWYSGFEIQGHDYWPEIIAEPINQMRDQEDPYFDPHTLEKLQMLPNSYLRYYYNTHKMLEKQESWPPSRAEEVMEIERDLLESYKDETLAEPPKNLMKRGGAYYSTVAAQLLNAHYNDLDEVHIVNTQNNGAVPSWDRDWVLEMPCRINAKGVFPVPTSPLPQECESLIQTVKAYEILTAQAAVEGDRDAAYKALLVHPLGPSADKITTVLDVMLETNRRYLPNFFKE